MKIRTILQTAVFLLASSFALAGSSTVTVLDSTGTTKTFDVVTDGSGNFVAKNVVCDQSAAANCAGVDAGHSLQIAGEGTAGSAAGGVVSVQGVGSGTALPVSAASLPLPSGAAISAAQNVNGQSTSHTCSTGGFSELGCLGQIDDDIKAAPAIGTSGGITPLKLNALGNTAVAIKASAGQLFLLQCGNTNASEAYVQVYNIAQGSVTVGTSTPTLSIPIAATSTGGFALSLVGLQFATAISAAATTTATGGTGPGTALDCNVGYN
jgi:hypothetical protein